MLAFFPLLFLRADKYIQLWDLSVNRRFLKYYSLFEGINNIANKYPFIVLFLFIHLLENAYKHSPAKLAPGAIKVKVIVKENELFFTVQNPIADRRDHSLEEPGGIGLANVQKRLRLIYRNHHQLQINKTEDIFRVELKITDIQKTS